MEHEVTSKVCCRATRGTTRSGHAVRASRVAVVRCSSLLLLLVSRGQRGFILQSSFYLRSLRFKGQPLERPEVHAVQPEPKLGGWSARASRGGFSWLQGREFCRVLLLTRPSSHADLLSKSEVANALVVDGPTQSGRYWYCTVL